VGRARVQLGSQAADRLCVVLLNDLSRAVSQADRVHDDGQTSMRDLLANADADADAETYEAKAVARDSAGP